MIRWFGAICLILAGGIFGWQHSVSDRQKVQYLSDLIHALELMRAEILNMQPTIPELLEFSIEQGSTVQPLFAEVLQGIQGLGIPQFANCWRTAVCRECSCLSNTEQSSLLALGSVLGQYDVEEEVNGIDRCLRELDTAYEKAKTQTLQNKAIYYGVGLTAAGMLAILLI